MYDCHKNMQKTASEHYSDLLNDIIENNNVLKQ